MCTHIYVYMYVYIYIYMCIYIYIMITTVITTLYPPHPFFPSYACNVKRSKEPEEVLYILMCKWLFRSHRGRAPHRSLCTMESED